MQESRLLGTLLPSSPDFLPIIQSLREKYNIPEINPDDDPINEIYLGDELISLDDFRLEIEKMVLDVSGLLPPEIDKLYKWAIKYSDQPMDMTGAETISDEWKQALSNLYRVFKSMVGVFKLIGDAFITPITNMIYMFILTGETDEVPRDWFSKVVTFESMGEKMIFTLASPFVDPEFIVQQFREEYKKTFGRHRPKITKTVVSTAYYLRLKRIGKPWRDILEEFIDREGISLPRDRTSKRYFDIKRKAEQLLKKRIQRSEAILDVMLRDKKPD